MKKGIKERPRKLYSYVLRSDSGFAPNPFGKYCTLACCKPVIRRCAQVGDWVAGTGSKINIGNDHLIYAMKVTEKLSFDEYFNDPRFSSKKPDTGLVEERGDNIYHDDRLDAKQSYHSEESREHDLGGRHVLVSDQFYYFGKEAVPVPEKLLEIIKKGPGHKCNFEPGVVERFVTWIERGRKTGKHGDPYLFEQRFGATKGCRC